MSVPQQTQSVIARGDDAPLTHCVPSATRQPWTCHDFTQLVGTFRSTFAALASHRSPDSLAYLEVLCGSCRTLARMYDEVAPVRDPDHQQPVPLLWRDTLTQIVDRICRGDYQLDGLPGVTPLPAAVGVDLLGDRIAAYGDVTLIRLPAETWRTSIAMWEAGTDLWHVLVDLHTKEEGRSDLVLEVIVSEIEGGTCRYDVYMIYVP